MQECLCVVEYLELSFLSTFTHVSTATDTYMHRLLWYASAFLYLNSRLHTPTYTYIYMHLYVYFCIYVSACICMDVEFNISLPAAV